MSEALERVTVSLPDLAKDPGVITERATKWANQLKDIAKKANLIVKIGKSEHVKVEGWTTVARFDGATVSTGKVEQVTLQSADGPVRGFKAEAEVLKDGVVVGRAEAYCMEDEQNWSEKPFYALASMAQTRAASKALKQDYSWVVVLAGYDPTPAEEMDGVRRGTPARSDPAAEDYRGEEGFDPGSDPWREQPGDRPAVTKEQAAAAAKEFISDAQRKRLYAIARNSGRNDQEFETDMRAMGYKSSREVLRRDYEDVCAHFQEGK